MSPTRPLWRKPWHCLTRSKPVSKQQSKDGGGSPEDCLPVNIGKQHVDRPDHKRRGPPQKLPPRIGSGWSDQKPGMRPPVVDLRVKRLSFKGSLPGARQAFLFAVCASRYSNLAFKTSYALPMQEPCALPAIERCFCAIDSLPERLLGVDEGLCCFSNKYLALSFRDHLIGERAIMPPKRKQQSTDNPAEASSDAEVAENVPAKPKRGRPPKAAPQSKPEQPAEPQVKRPRGRPKGMHMLCLLQGNPCHLAAAAVHVLKSCFIRLWEKARNAF